VIPVYFTSTSVSRSQTVQGGDNPHSLRTLGSMGFFTDYFLFESVSLPLSIFIICLVDTPLPNSGIEWTAVVTHIARRNRIGCFSSRVRLHTCTRIDRSNFDLIVTC
jgi:hypothetical protein